MTIDAARRQALLDAKLGALVAGGWGTSAAEGVAGTFPGGATRRLDRTGWVLAEDRPERALGPALAWARNAGVEDLHVLAGAASGALARRAASFSPAPHVWRVEGRSVAPARPDPVPSEPPPPAEAATFASLFADVGVEPVVEHGTLVGEVLGLEVARVVVDGAGAHLEVGVGRHDREAQKLLHGGQPARQALAAAAAVVRQARRPDAPSHPLNQLARERWLRAVVMAHPAVVGAATLAPVASPVRRANLRQRAPAPAAGVDPEGRPLLAVFSTGIDLDLVPVAADARLADGRHPRLVLVVPEADDHPLTRGLAAALAEPAASLTVPGDWRRL